MDSCFTETSAMTQAEIAWIFLRLLRGTRTYRGASFDCCQLDDAAQLRYARGLFLALPEPEKREIEASFGRIRDAVTAWRAGATRFHAGQNVEVLGYSDDPGVKRRGKIVLFDNGRLTRGNYNHPRYAVLFHDMTTAVLDAKYIRPDTSLTRAGPRAQSRSANGSEWDTLQ
jgi:hypothetical protein